MQKNIPVDQLGKTVTRTRVGHRKPGKVMEFCKFVCHLESHGILSNLFAVGKSLEF